MIERRRECVQDRFAQFVGLRDSGKGQLNRAAPSMPSPSSARSPSLPTLPINSAAERPTGVNEIWRNAERRFSAASGISICRNRSPGDSTLRWSPMTKSATLNLLLAAVGLPDRADAIERRGQRDHRTCRQRHAEIAADGRGLPDLERCQERAAALVDQRRGDPFRRAGQRIELRDRAGRGDGQAGFVDGQRRPSKIGQIDQPRQMDLRFREQPGPAGEPRIACRPNGQLRPALRTGNFGDGVQIHGYACAFNRDGVSV